jgi:hypothetical protein
MHAYRHLQVKRATTADRKMETAVRGSAPLKGMKSIHTCIHTCIYTYEEEGDDLS